MARITPSLASDDEIETTGQRQADRRWNDNDDFRMLRGLELPKAAAVAAAVRNNLW